MATKKLFYKNVDLKNQTILMRVDFNVPLKGTEIEDNTRITACVPTIQHIMSVPGTKLVLMSHLGRPNGAVKPEFSLKPTVAELDKVLGGKFPVHFAADCQNANKEVEALKEHEILILENLRFYPQEEKNDAAFAKKLAEYGTFFINDAFGAAHRAHASTAGITQFFPGKSALGDLMNLEVKYLGEAVSQPARPFVGILGGAKVSDKLCVVSNLAKQCDKLIIGGGMAYTFLRAQGKEVGLSLMQADKLRMCQQLLKDFGNKIILPVDALCCECVDFKNRKCSEPKVYNMDSVPANVECVDIGPASRKLFAEVIKGAKTVVWNGPMGVFEIEALAQGTNSIAQELAEITKNGAITVVGGGDSVSAVEKTGVKVSHVSTGGGASLEFLEGKVLPGVESLSDA